jgi:DNA-binding ferritin-like protein
MESNVLKRSLKTPSQQPQAASTSSKGADMGKLVSEFLEAVTSVHKAHLKITGPGSYAAHTAMGAFYDEIGDLADSIAESYQGVTETLLNIPATPQLSCTSAGDCVNFLNDLYQKVDAAQKACAYSEIINDLDNVKSLINSTKYKLIFLK